VLTTAAVRRVDFGYFVRPSSETETGHPQVCPVLGYVVDHPDGLLLFDTGLGQAGDETDAHYRPRRRPFVEALITAGVAADDVRWIVNCHLHFDHCGANPTFPGRPIIVQSTELAEARAGGYTVPELVDFDGATYEAIDGELEVLPGVWVIPSPGHTNGHQSLVVCCDDGSVIAAGQARTSATEYAAELSAVLAGSELNAQERPPIPGWLERLQQFDPRRIYFAHDLSVIEL
jgi:glyoxylase-like metal-dependent hydrolase (beta-lactamase superfamily II)